MPCTDEQLFDLLKEMVEAQKALKAVIAERVDGEVSWEAVQRDILRAKAAKQADAAAARYLNAIEGRAYGDGRSVPLVQAEEPADDIDPAQFAPGSYSAHEALHMASVFGDMVERHLCEHPAVAANEAWTALASRAATALHDLYQAIGAAHMGAIPEPPTAAPEPKEWR